MLHKQTTPSVQQQSIIIAEAVQGWLLEIAARNYTQSTRDYSNLYHASGIGRAYMRLAICFGAPSLYGVCGQEWTCTAWRRLWGMRMFIPSYT